MGSLPDYIRDMQAQGYTKAQITAQLKKSNYAPSAIDAAFKESRPLLDAHLTTTPNPKHWKLPVLPIVFLVIVAIAILFSLYLVTKTAEPHTTAPVQPQQTTLSMELETSTQSLLPGESFTARATVHNPAAQRNADLIFRLEGDTVVYSNKKTRPLTQEMTTAELIELPADTAPGKYQLTVELPDEGIAKTVAITVLGATTPTQSTVALAPTPAFATKNTETKIDGAAIAAQQGNTKQAETTCAEITNQASRDDCYAKLTLTTKNPAHCAEITSQESQDTCYMPFILDGKYEFCDELHSEDRKDLCAQLQMLDSL